MHFKNDGLELCEGKVYDDIVHTVVEDKNNNIQKEKEKEKEKLVSEMKQYSVCISSSSCIYNNRVVGLDTLASVSIFRNNAGIIDTWKCDGILISGVSNKGGSLVVNKKGISDSCSANILSLGSVRDSCHNLEYDTENDIFKVTVFKNGSIYLFYRNSENLCNLDSQVVHAKVMVETV